MDNLQIIPLKQKNNYKFSVTLDVNNTQKTLYFRQLFNSVVGYWTLDISDGTKDLITNLPLVPNAGNILKQYNYLQIGSAWLIPIGDNINFPAWDDIETDWLLIWGDNYG